MLGSATAFLPVPLMYLMLRFRVIAMEEEMLEEAFGEEYLEYKRKVRRWL
jgi:protein-S-isoprenylcysteine O-methyltransferase Ste14